MKNKKSLGQHWLKNRAILDEIAEEVASGVAWGEVASEIETANKGTGGTTGQAEKADGTTEVGTRGAEVCLEIGPGLGTLTSSLLKRFQKVIAVEYDERLAANLPKSFPGKNLEVVNEDILSYDFSKLPTPFVVAGNIPYYITSPIIEKLLTLKNLPERVVLLIQKEVAERILADKGSVLSLMVENRAETKPGILVSRTEFTPPPKIDSATIILKPHPPRVRQEVFDLIRMGFSSPRKKLFHNLAGVAPRERTLAAFLKLGISPDARPADLKLSDWQALYDEYHSVDS